MSTMEKNGNATVTAALIFALVAAVFSALTYFAMPMMVTSAIENVEAMKVGGPEKYEQLKTIYKENAAVFGEQVDQIQAQIDMYKQMQQSADETGMMQDDSGDAMMSETMPNDQMMMTGDEAMMAQ